MNDKPKSGIFAFLIAVPAMVLCCLGLVIFASSTAGLLSWAVGGGILLATIVAAAAGVLVLFFHRRRRLHAIDAKIARHGDSAEASAQLPVQEHN